MNKEKLQLLAASNLPITDIVLSRKMIAEWKGEYQALVDCLHTMQRLEHVYLFLNDNLTAQEIPVFKSLPIAEVSLPHKFVQYPTWQQMKIIDAVAELGTGIDSNYPVTRITIGRKQQKWTAADLVVLKKLTKVSMHANLDLDISSKLKTSEIFTQLCDMGNLHELKLDADLTALSVYKIMKSLVPKQKIQIETDSKRKRQMQYFKGV